MSTCCSSWIARTLSCMGEQIIAHVQESGGRALPHRVTSYCNDSLVAADDASMTYEIEYNCRQAGRFRGEPADAATTGRSDRTDGVHRALLDGSVRFFDESSLADLAGDWNTSRWRTDRRLLNFNESSSPLAMGDADHPLNQE